MAKLSFRPRPRATAPTEVGSYTPPASRSRVDAVDLLRGLVMVIMLLDHTRDFVHADGLRFDPSDLTQTTSALFLTRWITHFCAPVFVLLAGTGAYLQLARGKTKAQLSRFLLTRGLWLVVLEFTVVRALVFFDFDYAQLFGFAQVIWAIGVSMIVLAALMHLPLRGVLAVGLAMILLHNALDGVTVTPWQGPGSPAPGFLGGLWMVLHQPGPLPVLGFPGPVVFILYPLVPLIGVMAVGYALGAVYELPAERRRRLLLGIGIVATAGFVALRALNIYGDPSRWAVQARPVFTVLSFMNTTKYPTSLLFLAMTIGPSLMALALFERAEPGRLARWLITYGRVPLFFYLLQWAWAHTMGLGLSLAAGKPTGHLVGVPFGNPIPPDAGFPLWVVYLVWAAGVIALHPLCGWFAALKARRRDWWLSYL
jgi:uncharacterized membrane protein